jgi:hypothetical protein
VYHEQQRCALVSRSFETALHATRLYGIDHAFEPQMHVDVGGGRAASSERQPDNGRHQPRETERASRSSRTPAGAATAARSRRLGSDFFASPLLRRLEADAKQPSHRLGLFEPLHRERDRRMAAVAAHAHAVLLDLFALHGGVRRGRA